MGVCVWRAPVGAGAETEAERHSQAKDNKVCVWGRGAGRGRCVWCGVAGRGVRVCVCVRARARACGHACGVWAEAERHSQAKDNAVCVCVCVVCRALRVCGGGEGVRVGGGVFMGPYVKYRTTRSFTV